MTNNSTDKDWQPVLNVTANCEYGKIKKYIANWLWVKSNGQKILCKILDYDDDFHEV